MRTLTIGTVVPPPLGLPGPVAGRQSTIHILAALLSALSVLGQWIGADDWSIL